jgi:hypothetical protein
MLFFNFVNREEEEDLILNGGISFSKKVSVPAGGIEIVTKTSSGPASGGFQTVTR